MPAKTYPFTRATMLINGCDALKQRLRIDRKPTMLSERVISALDFLTVEDPDAIKNVELVYGKPADDNMNAIIITGDMICATRNHLRRQARSRNQSAINNAVDALDTLIMSEYPEYEDDLEPMG